MASNAGNDEIILLFSAREYNGVQEQIDTTLRQIAEARSWFNDSAEPTWYLTVKQAYLQNP
jgi:hypothetical protein